MSAVQVDTTSGVLIAAKNYNRRVTIQNLGPNAIVIELGADAEVAEGLSIAATSGIVQDLFVPAGVAVHAITTSAIQATPADTRVLGV